MITFFLGEDTNKSKKAVQEAVSRIVDADTEVVVHRFNDVNFGSGAILEAMSAQNLFGAQNIVVLEDILDHQEGEDFYLRVLGKAENQVFVRERAPNKELLKHFEELGEVRTFPIFKKEKKMPMSFAVADAVAMRDKKLAWVEYTHARAEGAAPEELHGTIFWAMKLLYLCANCPKDVAIAAGVSNYNYPRSLTWSKKFLAGELESKLRELRDMYHNAHRGEGELDYLLEQFILKS